MLKTRTFSSGGVHPPTMKTTAQFAIKDLPLPTKVVLHTSQHIGAPAKPTHKITDNVTCGEPIAEPGAFVSAPIHATISGKIIGVGNFMHPFGIKSPAIVIERNLEEQEPEYTVENGFNLSVEEIQNRIRSSGIVGLGGATFPTHVKLAPPPDKNIDLLIINGVECEPALTADHRIMLEHPQKLIDGIRLIVKVLKAERCIIGIEENKPDAIELLTKLTQDTEDIQVQPLELKYPQGGEKQLIEACTGRIVPSGKLPMDIGVVVQNVASATAISDAVNMQKPLIEKVVTLSGNCVNNPGNYRVRIGTTIDEFIKMTGGLKEGVKLEKVIMGGPMMGFAMFDLHIPVIKGTSGILCWDEQQAKQYTETSCIRCGSCVNACPMRLMSQQLKVLVDFHNWQKAFDMGVLDCMECGCCSYVCPAALPLVQTFKYGKKIVINQQKNGSLKKD